MLSTPQCRPESLWESITLKTSQYHCVLASIEGPVKDHRNKQALLQQEQTHYQQINGTHPPVLPLANQV